MANAIHVEEGALNTLKNAIQTAGQDFKTDLARLTVLIEEITSGDIKGDPATDLLNKFQAKEDVFKGVTKTIEEAEEYMGVQTNKFSGMIEGLKVGMK